MIVLDASVLIAHLDAADAQHERAGELLSLHSAEDLGASVLTLAETLVSPARADRVQLALGAISRLEIAAIPIDMTAPARLAALRAGTNLRLPDCCVLLAAQDAGAAVVLTFDEQLASASRSLGFSTI